MAVTSDIGFKNNVHLNNKKGDVVITFQYANDLQTTDRQKLRGFSLDGKTEVNAVIQNNKFVISANSKPAYIYYGCKPFTDANLVNAEHLSASTFKVVVQ